LDWQWRALASFDLDVLGDDFTPDESAT